MRPDKLPPVFEGRADAGRRLAKRLKQYPDGVVIGLARGGISVAAAVAHRLSMPWNVMVTRKLTIPWCPGAGFGAAASDGSVVLNYAMLGTLDIPQHEIDKIAAEAVDDARKQARLYASYRQPDDLHNRTVILIDDALTMGYSMLAGIKSARAQGASQVIAAAPVASRASAHLVRESADESIFEVISPSIPFSAADFYVSWPEVTEEEALGLLR